MRAVLFVALWVGLSIPVAFGVGAVLRGVRASELAEQVDAYLRRLAGRPRTASTRHTTRVVLVCAGLAVVVAGSLPLVSDVPERIITAGIRNADFFGPGPGSGSPAGSAPGAGANAGPGPGTDTDTPSPARRLSDAFGTPLTADDLGIPAPGTGPADAAPPTGSPSSGPDAEPGESGDDPSREPATIARTGDGEPVPESSDPVGPDGGDGDDDGQRGSPSGQTATTTTTAPASTTTTSTSTTSTTTTAPEPTTTSTTTTTETTSTTTTTTEPPSTTTTVPGESPPPDGDSSGNGNGMGPIEHEPSSYEGDTDGGTEPALDRSADGGETDASGAGTATSRTSTSGDGMVLAQPEATEPERAPSAESSSDPAGFA